MSRITNAKIANRCTAVNHEPCMACDIDDCCPRQERGFKDLKTAMIISLNKAFDQLMQSDFYEGSRPMLFIQEPFRGTHAMVFLKEVLHPSDTVKCMNTIFNQLEYDRIEGCLIANDLTTLEVNLDID